MPEEKQPIAEIIESRLIAAFDPQELEVRNTSAAHAGHAGSPGTGESHFELRIRADHFTGMTRIAKHRAVHKALGDVMDRIHALGLDLE